MGVRFAMVGEMAEYGYSSAIECDGREGYLLYIL